MPNDPAPENSQEKQEMCHAWRAQLEELKTLTQKCHQAWPEAIRARDFSALKQNREKMLPILRGLQETFRPFTKEEKDLLIGMMHDYTASRSALESFGILNRLRGSSYEADYGEFAGKAFKIPLWQSIQNTLKKNKKILGTMKKLKEKGQSPHLYLIPMGLKIDTICKKFNAPENRANQVTGGITFVNKIQETGLKYLPEYVSARAFGDLLNVREGKSKSQIITENSGWQIIIMDPHYDEIDPEIAGEEDAVMKEVRWRQMTNVQKTANYTHFQQENGLTGLTVEDILLLQLFDIIIAPSILTGVFPGDDSHVITMEYDRNNKQFKILALNLVDEQKGRMLGASRSAIRINLTK